MKLRLRFLQSKETLIFEVTTPCSLHNSTKPSLTISRLLHHLFFISHSIETMSFKLLHLKTLFKSLTLAPSVQKQQKLSQSDMGDTNRDESQTLDSNTRKEQQTPVHAPSVQQQQLSDSDMGDTNLEGSKSLDSNTQKKETVENNNIDDGSGSAVVENKFSVPCFLWKVLRDELGDGASDHRLLVIAVHAVLLETGFVGFDSVSGMRVDRFHLPNEWPSPAFMMSLWYTLPEMISSGSDEIETVVVNIQSLGQFFIVYGSLARNGSCLYRVCLNEYRFAPTIDLVWAKCDWIDGMSETDRYCNPNLYPENEVFEFWKIVKEGVALPLLKDLRDRASLIRQPCLMRLPKELKLMILELLPAIDVAKVACVCSELRGLSSNNDLWKQRFVEEFGTASVNYYVWTEKFLEELGTNSFNSYVWEKKFVEDFGTESWNYYLWKEKFIEEIMTAAKGKRFTDHWQERFAGGRWRERFVSSWESRKKRKGMWCRVLH